MVSSHQMHEPGANAADLVVDGPEAGQQLLDSKFAEGIAALELGNVQGHNGAWYGSGSGGRRAADWGSPCLPGILKARDSALWDN
jgi:hypothetical protein